MTGSTSGRKVWTKAAVRWLDAQISLIKRSPNETISIKIRGDGRLAAEDVANYLSKHKIRTHIGKDSDVVHAIFEQKVEEQVVQ